MAKKLEKIEVNILCEPDINDVWQAQVSADLTVIVEEFPEFRKRKNIPITLTGAQAANIISFVRNVIVPAAEIGK